MQSHGENNGITIKDLTKTKKMKVDNIAVQLEVTLVNEVLYENINLWWFNFELAHSTHPR